MYILKTLNYICKLKTLIVKVIWFRHGMQFKILDLSIIKLNWNKHSVNWFFI